MNDIATISTPRRPALRWHGGKWMLAPWIIEHFPPHEVYCEPYGGAASVLLRKDRARLEIYNDLDQEVVNLFRVLRSSRACELIDALRLTPFCRTEFDDAYTPTNDPVERARRLAVRSYFGYGSDGAFIDRRRTGFRPLSRVRTTTPAQDWSNYPDALTAIIERFSGVVIESKPAADVMAACDGADALHYVDPPYLHETRSMRKMGDANYHGYTHEMGADDHTALLECLRGLAGMVVLSGYPSDLYDDALTGWRRVERSTMADGARERTEVLWINPAAAGALDAKHPTLFNQSSPNREDPK